MIANDANIEALCKNVKLIEDYDPARVSPASYDLELFHEIYVMGSIETGKIVPELQPDGTILNRPYVQSIWTQVDISGYSKESPLYIPSMTRILACSKRIVNIPSDLVATLHLCSTEARLFWEHLNACYIDPQFSGRITFELVNLSLGHLVVYPGMRIGQLSFSICEPPVTGYATTGRYQNDLKPQPAKEKK